MWCPQCRQDVPGIASGPVGKLCCVRCRAMVERSTSSTSTTSSPAPAQFPSEEFRTDVDIAEQLEALERLTWDLGDDMAPSNWPEAMVGDRTPSAFSGRHGLLDQAHKQLRGWHRQGAEGIPPGFSLIRLGRKSLAGWLMLSFGLTSFFCGAVLLTWSLFGNRPDLWTIGVPITLAGQVGLLLGVVLALDRLGHQNRQTVDRLGRLDERLDELRSVAWLSGPNSNPAASAENSRKTIV